MNQGHKGTLYPRTYLSWMSTARLVIDLSKEVSDESLTNVPGLMFGDNSFIEIRKQRGDNGKEELVFASIAGTEEIESNELFTVIEFLWYTHSSHEWPNV